MLHCCHPPPPPAAAPQVIWLSCLPLGLWASVGWGTVPLTVVISFLLLGIEEIGVAIEEVRPAAWMRCAWLALQRCRRAGLAGLCRAPIHPAGVGGSKRGGAVASSLLPPALPGRRGPTQNTQAACPPASPTSPLPPLQPFSILPLDELCHEIEVGLSDIVEQAGSSKRAAKEAVSAAAAAAVSAAAAEAAAAVAAASDAGPGSSSNGSGGGAQVDAPVGVAANAVAPLMPGALGRASVSRELVPAAALMSADAIFNSLDEGDA